MSQIPSMAVVLEGGLIQSVIIQDWPGQLPLPRVAIVDYDIEGASDDEITRFAIGDKLAEAVCRDEMPLVYETLTNALSPKTVLAAMGKAVDVDSEAAQPVLAIACKVHRRILELDARLDRLKQSPTGDHYNELHRLANGGLLKVLNALGDPLGFNG